MNKRLYILIVPISFFLVECNEKEIDINPDSLYCVTTTDGDGFAHFEQAPDGRWGGIYYLSRGQLVAEKHIVDLEIGDELSIIDETGREIPIISYSRYEEPEFKDYPETWAYKDSAYSFSIKKEIYGRAQGYWTNCTDTGGTYIEIFEAKQQEIEQGEKELELAMDVYIPNDRQDATRPLLVLIHGGAFLIGDKSDLGFPDWAQYFASMGYVVALVNYRLGFRKNIASVKRAGIRSVQDIDAAIRYIIHHKDTFLVDPDRIFVAGTSAGGITALNVAFMRDENIPSEAKEEGGIKSLNPEMDESYSIRAVGNMWGAVNDLSILNNAPSSVISFHNIGDPIVPFGKGHPFKNVILNWLLFPTMYGSGQISEYLGNQRSCLKDYNLPNEHTLHIEKDEHGDAFLSSRFYEIETDMRDFFSAKMLPSPATYTHNSLSQTFQVTSSDLDSVFWHVEGGVIFKHNINCIDVLLFPDVNDHAVTVSGKYKSGLSFRNTWSF